LLAFWCALASRSLSAKMRDVAFRFQFPFRAFEDDESVREYQVRGHI
jgi:hypothetical protein